MKALTIKQPWASMIAQGYKDIENRSWETEYRGKVLIHAAADKRHWRSLGYEGLDNKVVINEHLFGNLADRRDAVYSAIIGYATLEDIIEDSESIWAHHGSKHWVFKDAYLFDEPIMNVKGKLGLWDYPDITEDNLPSAHKFERKYVPSVEGETICIPIAKEVFDIHKFDFVELEITDEIHELLLDKNRKIKPFTQVKLFTPTDSVIYPIKKNMECNLTREDDLESWVYYKDQYGEEYDYTFLRFEFPNCKDPVKGIIADKEEPTFLDFLASIIEQQMKSDSKKSKR